MEAAVVVLVLVNTILLVWLARRGIPRTSSVDAEATPGRELAARASVGLRPDRSDLPGRDENADRFSLAKLSEGSGIAELTPVPADTGVRVLGVLSEASSHALVAAPALRALGSGDLYRMVSKPAGEFLRKPDETFKAITRVNGRISGHADWAEVSTRSVQVASALGSLATIAAGAYWQQQVDQKLDRLQEGLDGVTSRLNATLLAELAVAHDALSLDEAADLDGPYRPSAAVTDGLRAARIDVIELRQHFEKRVADQGALEHRDYVDRILRTAQDENVTDKFQRAAFGVTLEMRVLKLKWSHSYGQPPAYIAQLATELDDLLGRVDTLVSVGRKIRAIESDHPADWKRILGSKRKLEHAAAQAKDGRHAIGDTVSVLSDRLEEVYSLRRPEPEEVEVLLGFDGQRMLVMAPSTPDCDAYRSP